MLIDQVIPPNGYYVN